MRGMLFAAVLLGGCLKAGTGYRCASDTECSGTCESTGYCSFGDSSCPSGRRYGAQAGSLSNGCVEQMVDAAVTEMLVDTFLADAPPAMPHVVASNVANAGALATLSYPLAVPAGTNRFLIVSVHLGSNCTTAIPDIASVSFNGVPLTQVTSLVGTSCTGDVHTRSDQWQLIAPAVGSHLVNVTLAAATTFTIQSGAIAFEGVDQVTPIRTTSKAASNGTSSYIEVASMPNDLVIDTVGTGGMFVAPDASQTQVFLHNTSGGNTLNNCAASTKPGASGLVAFIWTGNNDVYQDIASSLRPAP